MFLQEKHKSLTEEKRRVLADTSCPAAVESVPYERRQG